MARLKNHAAAEIADNLALILIDYDNLVDSFGMDEVGHPHAVVLGMVQELRRYLSEELRVKPVRAVAYGDFGASGEDASVVMSALAGIGVETRHVPPGIQPTDSTLSLTVHATELLHARPDLSAFVVLSGDSWFVPLIQHLQRFGKFVMVAALDLPTSASLLWGDVSDAFLNARFLVDPGDRDSISRRRQVSEKTGERPGSPETQSRAPSKVARIEDAGVFRALEVLEEYFGQYEEVYLTPLLRKMSESLDGEDGEPKDLVNSLQEAGAVWLEKRRGFPYDYTVLMVNDEHPDVADVRASSPEDGDYERDDFTDSYDDDDLGEESAYQDSKA